MIYLYVNYFISIWQKYSIQEEIFYSETKKRNLAYIITKFRLKGFRKTKEKIFKLSTVHSVIYICFQINLTFRAEKFSICNRAFISILSTIYNRFLVGKTYPQNKWKGILKESLTMFRHLAKQK